MIAWGGLAFSGPCSVRSNRPCAARLAGWLADLAGWEAGWLAGCPVVVGMEMEGVGK